MLVNSALGVLAEESGADSGGTSTTTYFTRAPDGTLLGERTPSGNYYHIQDANGSVIALTNSSGTVANTYTYDPYGMTVTETGTAPNPFGFDGGFQTPGGLYHFGARIYNPLTGSWTQPDPEAQSLVTDPTQSDPYSFAGDDPVNNVDPTGDSKKLKHYTACLLCIGALAGDTKEQASTGSVKTPMCQKKLKQ